MGADSNETYKSNQTDKVHIKASLPLIRISDIYFTNLAKNTMVQDHSVQTAESRHGDVDGLLREAKVRQVAVDDFNLLWVFFFESLERGEGSGDDYDVVLLRGCEEVFGDAEADACGIAIAIAISWE
jgi:hypothetical protein